MLQSNNSILPTLKDLPSSFLTFTAVKFTGRNRFAEPRVVNNNLPIGRFYPMNN